MWCVLQKWGNFAHFQSSISPLSLMMELRFSLLTCRNSYIVYPKNVFSMTLSLSIKVKLHTCLALPYFHQKLQPLHSKTFKTSQKQSFILNILPFSDFFRFCILEGMGSNFTKACYLNVTPVHSIQGIIIFKKPLLQLLASICWNDIIKNSFG